jgi:hypothetical protein
MKIASIVAFAALPFLGSAFAPSARPVSETTVFYSARARANDAMTLSPIWILTLHDMNLNAHILVIGF